MQVGKKIAVGCLLSAGLVIVVIEAVRLSKRDPGGVRKLDSVYATMEPVIAIMVACLPTYKSIFHVFSVKSRLTARYHNEGYELGEKSPPPLPAMLSQREV